VDLNCKLFSYVEVDHIYLQKTIYKHCSVFMSTFSRPKFTFHSGMSDVHSVYGNWILFLNFQLNLVDLQIQQ